MKFLYLTTLTVRNIYQNILNILQTHNILKVKWNKYMVMLCLQAQNSETVNVS